MDKLSRDTLSDLQVDYLDYEYSEDELALYLLNAHKMGIHSYDFLSALGYHTTNWSAMGKICNKLKKRHGLTVKQLPRGKGKGKLLITEANYTSFYAYMRKARKVVARSGIKAPEILTKARAEGQTRKRLETEALREARRVDYDARRIERLTTLYSVPEMFTVYDVAKAANINRVSASKLINDNIKLETVKLIHLGCGRGDLSIYKFVVPRS